LLRNLAVFDMDGVLIHPRSSWRIVHKRLGTRNENGFMLYMEGAIDDEEFMRRDIAIWKGSRPGIDLSFLDDLFGEVPLMDGLDDALTSLRDAEFDLIILSGGLSMMACKVDRAGYFVRRFVNDLATDPRGRLTGEGILVVPLRDKGSVLKGFLDSNDHGSVVTVGDSWVDASMFRHSDLSIAFRPMDEVVIDAADLVIERSDLREVSSAILDHIKRP